MEIVVSNERKTVPIGSLNVGDTFIIESIPAQVVFMVTDEYADDNEENVLCVDLASGVIQRWTRYDTEVTPVKCKLEVKYNIN